ncbi:MAG: inositol monophosphatase family protein [Phyllobacterium sp.]
MTSPAKSDISTRYELARTLAREAGRIALDFFNRREELVVEIKGDPQDVVSIADRQVEEMIRQRIADAHPDDSILGEEYGLTDGSSGFTWVIDPIDGTSPFVNGMPSWCVSIAVLHGETPVVGVIYAPCNDELFAAASGHGANLNGKSLKLDAVRTIRNGVTGIGANHHVKPATVAKLVEDLLTEGGNFIRNGSGALMLAYVAAGRLVGYYEPYMHAWDCLAGYCLVTEAGGWHLPFPVANGGLTRGSPVLAAGPGSTDDLRRVAGV